MLPAGDHDADPSAAKLLGRGEHGAETASSGVLDDKLLALSSISTALSSMTLSMSRII
jgi:hypothetical protein